MFESARVLNAETYALGSQPFLVEQVAAAALAELRRKREEAGKPAPKEPLVDPEALRQREEAAELRAHAARLLQAAQAKAGQIEEKAQAEALKLAEEAKSKGYQEGFAKGMGEGEESGEKKGLEAGLGKYHEGVSRFAALLESARVEKDAYFTDREALMVELVNQVAAKVIHREVETRPDHIQNLLRKAIQALSDKSRLVVTLHSDDLERVSKARSEGLLGIPGVKQMEFLADDRILQGGMRIASGNQTLDAALDSQLAELCRSLLEEATHEA